MRRHVTLALAAAVALAAASQAEAAITVTVSQVNIATDIPAGWTGYVLTMQASGTVVISGVTVPETIGALDMANPQTGVTGTPGISGTMLQSAFGGGTSLTPTTPGGTSQWLQSQTNDSTLLNFGYWNGSTPNPAAENNSLTGSPLTGSGDSYYANFGSAASPVIVPLAGTFGIGTLITFSGSALFNPLATPPQFQTAGPQQFALIIAPTGTGDTSFHGRFLDNANNAYPINLVINAPVPEPASLGVLALGGLGLLAKRRRRA